MYTHAMRHVRGGSARAPACARLHLSWTSTWCRDLVSATGPLDESNTSHCTYDAVRDKSCEYKTLDMDGCGVE